jgi:hypothetical protein
MARHIIHTQRLELNYAKEELARADQNRWGEIYEKELLPVMEEIFDRYEQNGFHLRLDRLDLNLGSIPPSLDIDILKSRLKNQLEDQLAVSLDKKLKGKDFEKRSQDSNDTSSPSDEESHSTWELFIHLLRYGSRPWWSSTTKKPSLKTVLQDLIEAESQKLIEFLEQKKLSSQEWKRLNQVLDFQNTYDLLSLHSPHFSINARRLYSACRKLLVNNWLTKDQLEELLIEFFMMDLKPFSEKSEEEIREFSAAIFKPDLETNSDFFIHLMAWLLSKKTPEMTAPKIREVGKELLTKSRTYGFYRSWSSTGERRESLLKKFTEAYLQYSKQKIKEKPKRLDTPKPQDDEVFIVSNAGLVILGPFLKHFFSNLGYLEDKNFKDQSSQERAALLLQNLVDPNAEYAEEDLLLNKILCGIPIHQAIPIKASFSDAEKEESMALLESVAHHWEALKTTSGPAMAKGFFPREGSIRIIDSGFKLQVNRLSFDILIDRLPWAISIIKLPWMDETLITEW